MKYYINDIASTFNISQYTLRYYDSKGLLPFVKRDSSNRRYFCEQDLEWIYMIKCLKETGLPLNLIKIYVSLGQNGNETIKERQNILEKHKITVQKELLNIEEKLKMIDYKISSYKNNRVMENPFKKIVKKD